SDQLSLAIGRGGQNVRLAARLTGWKVNIQEVKPEGAEAVAEATTEEASVASEEVPAEAAPSAPVEPASEETTVPESPEKSTE
ncbi:MAG: transcription termination/antitermination protein NusA, partial [Candidatus Uhrbacteria bacterium]|nr:transcription termination/antitermination protein NusA [Candidatus Uhrbacteria bacterium]